MEERNELLPCPMCDKAGRLFQEGRNHEHKPLFHVRCKRSRCELRTKNYLVPKKAITAWNTRTSQNDGGEALEALNNVSCEITAMEWFENYANSDTSIVAEALKRPLTKHLQIDEQAIHPASQLVTEKLAVEALKMDKCVLSEHDIGWNDCIDYLHQQGLITYKP